MPQIKDIGARDRRSPIRGKARPMVSLASISSPSGNIARNDVRVGLTPQQIESFVQEGNATNPVFVNPMLQRQGEKTRQLINPDPQTYEDRAIALMTDAGRMDPRKWGTGLSVQKATNIPSEMEYATAFVPFSDPRKINIVDPRWQNLWESGLDKDTLSHEVEHSLAYTGGSELGPSEAQRQMGKVSGGRSRSDVLMDSYAALKDPEYSGKKKDDHYSPVFKLFENAANSKIGSHLKSKYGVSPTYLGSGVSNNWMSPFMYEELAADLGMVMNASKKDIFADPFLQKELFNNDPLLMEAVRATLHVEPRMDAKDPQRLTASPENVDRFKKLLGQGSATAGLPLKSLLK